jgi:hypothetical protein
LRLSGKGFPDWWLHEPIVRIGIVIGRRIEWHRCTVQLVKRKKLPGGSLWLVDKDEALVAPGV